MNQFQATIERAEALFGGKVQAQVAFAKKWQDEAVRDHKFFNTSNKRHFQEVLDQMLSGQAGDTAEYMQELDEIIKRDEYEEFQHGWNRGGCL